MSKVVVLVLFLLGIAAAMGWIAFTYIPVFATQILGLFEPGLGFRTSAIIGFVVTVLLLAFFAIVSEGGIFGEVEVLVGSFFTFFFILSLVIAWIF